jgi:beta-lactamase regulating signal transducer with metallopeptidase domain
MTLLLNCVIQVTVILSIALLSLPLLRKQSAAVRHCVLTTAIVFSILTPVFNLVMPVWNWSAAVSAFVSQHPSVAPIHNQISAITSPATRALTQTQRMPNPGAGGAVTAVTGHPSEGSARLTQLLSLIWAVGVLGGLVELLTGLARLAGVVSASVPMVNGPWKRLAALIASEYGLKSVVHLLESRNRSVLVTWGVIRPTVVLPAGSAEWPEERATIVLRHELAHIRRGDWVVQMIAQALRIACWFNPLVWIVCRHLRLESECACDDCVLSKEIKAHEYAQHLLDLARLLNRSGQAWSAALTMARPSTIERRFSAMLNPALNRYPVTRFALFSMAFVALVITLFLSAASTATPIRSISENPTPPGPEKPVASVGAKPERVPARVEPVASPISMPRQSIEQVSRATSQRRRASALDRALFEVAEDGDVSDIQELLRAGANVNSVIMGDGTPLMGASGKGHIEAVRLLLDHGADPNTPVSGDGNALIVGARHGHIDVVRLLLDRGADPNAAVLGDGNALIMAAREGHANVVTLLLDRGANIDQVVPGDENALIGASGAGHLNVVQLLVSRRADVNARVWVEATPWRPFGEWRSPLSEARKQRHQDIVQFLLSVGARD